MLGLQCNTWSEYIYSPEHRQYMMFPRAFAVAETGWTPKDKKDWDSFRVRVEKACHDLDLRGVNYHIPLPEQPEGSCNNLAFSDKKEIAFKTTRPVEKMVYTLDGSEPGLNSATYTQPLVLTEPGVVKIASVTPYGKLSPVRTITLRKETPWPAVEAHPGIRAWRADGRFLTAADLKGVQWNEVSIKRLRDLNTLEAFDRNLPDSTRYYAACAEASFRVRETGTYRFSSDCDQVWIDGKLLIDNGAEVKRFSRHDAEAVLEAGAHDIKVIYIFNTLGGWNSLRNRTDVQIRKEGATEWKPVQLL